MSTPVEQAATATIAGVLRQHEIGYQRCSCGWFTEHGVVWESVSQHLADVISAALQLREEWTWYWETLTWDGGKPVSRLVGPWRTAEEKPKR